MTGQRGQVAHPPERGKRRLSIAAPPMQLRVAGVNGRHGTGYIPAVDLPHDAKGLLPAIAGDHRPRRPQGLQVARPIAPVALGAALRWRQEA